jgi:hypothetical protein
MSVANMARVTLAFGAAHNTRPRSQKLHSADQYQFTFLLLDLHIFFIYVPHDLLRLTELVTELVEFLGAFLVELLSFLLEPPTLLFQFSNLCPDVTITPQTPPFAVWLND